LRAHVLNLADAIVSYDDVRNKRGIGPVAKGQSRKNKRMEREREREKAARVAPHVAVLQDELQEKRILGFKHTCLPTMMIRSLLDLYGD